MPTTASNPTTYNRGLILVHFFGIVFVSTAEGIIAWANRRLGPAIREQARANHSIFKLKPTCAHWSVVSD
ncbi:uncharacterized protein METZ01_LOCUS454401 [marine metagenome]|uniref:Uncharacterized protein n=1 Tax=marine metagenome TaxID=408172 RepID=A0A383A140_9ZZZZ